MPASKDRLKRLEGELCRARREVRRSDRALEVGEGQARRSAETQEGARQLRVELADAQRRGEYQRAGELAYGRIPELEKKLADIEESEAPAERDDARRR